jgi:hypothetical protein
MGQEGKVTYEWSPKRKDLWFMGKLIESFARAVVDDPHMPDNPWNMTLAELNRHIIDELGNMNSRGEW